MRQAQVEDWLEDLIEFGPAVVADACREWRRSPINRRPVPGEIRKLCIEATSRQQSRIAVNTPTDMDEYARSVGWASEAERREAIRRDGRDREARYERARLVREAAGMPRPAAQDAAAAGVKVREYTADELRKGRIALGLEHVYDEEGKIVVAGKMTKDEYSRYIRSAAGNL